MLSAGVGTERTGNPAMALIRTSPEGMPDPSWDGDGTALVRAREASVATDVVLDASGRAVAAGHSSQGGDHAFMLARFDAAGVLDRGFGGQGVVLTDFPGTTVARATALALQADGKLVVAGIACVAGSGPQCAGGTARLALARYQGGDAGRRPDRPGRAAARRRPAGSPQPRRSCRCPGACAPAAAAVKVRVRCLQAKRCRGKLSLRRLRTGRRSLLLGSRTISVAGHHARTFTVKLRRKRLGSAPEAAGAHRVRGPRRGRQAAEGHAPRDAAAAAERLPGASRVIDTGP